MFEYTIKTLWGSINNIYKMTIGEESLGLMTLIVLLHIFLALATLSLGDRTVCDIFRPLRKIFKPDTDAILDGILEVAIAIPRAIIYYGSLYFRSYILAFRITFLLLVSAIPAMMTPLMLLIIQGLIFGFSTPVEQHMELTVLIIWSVYPSFAYWYWRIDGRRLYTNFRNSWQC